MSRERNVIKYVTYQALNDNGNWGSSMHLMVNWGGDLSSLKEALKYRAYNQYRSSDVRIISHENGMVWDNQVITDKYKL